MPSTYTVNLGIEKPATGEQSGTWGDTTNVNFDILDQAINGAARVTLTSAGSSGSPNALIITNGAASDGRNKWIEFYSSGDLGGDVFVQLQPNDAEKIVFVRNSLAGSQSVLLFQGTYNSGRDLEIPAGVDMVVKFDGGGASAANVTDVYNNLKVTGLVAGTADINGGTVDGTVIGGASAAALTATTVVANTSFNIAGDGATVTGIKDEDNMASNSATKLATQQSIKAYVDSQVGTVDTLSEILANGNTTGANDIDVDAAQKVQFRDAAIYINSSVDGQLDIVADTEIQIAATTIDINGAIVASGEISAASLDISGDVDIDGTLNVDAIDIDGAVQLDNTLTVGVDDTGYDVKFYGATGGAYMLWDESADDLILAGAGGLVVAGNVDFNGDLDVDGTTNLDVVDIDGAVDMASTLGVTGLITGTTATFTRLEINATNTKLKGDLFANTDAAFDIGASGASRPRNLYLSNSITAADITTTGNGTFNRVIVTDGVQDTGQGGSATVFNESGSTADFRVESDSNANMLFVDGGANRVAIGSSGYTNDTDLNLLGDGLSIKNDKDGSNNNWSFIQNTATSSGSNLKFTLGTGNVEFTTGGSIVASTVANYHTVFNEDGVDSDFRVESEDSASMFKVDAALNQVQITGDSANSDSSLLVRNNYNTVLKVIQDDTSLSSATYAFMIDSSAHVSNMTTAGAMRVETYYGDSFHVNGLGTTVINEVGAATGDFRVESDTNANMLFVDGGANKVGIGTNSLSRVFNVYDPATDGAIKLETGGNASNIWAGVEFKTPNSQGFIYVPSDSTTGLIKFLPAASEVLALSNSAVVVNETGSNVDFRVESDTNANMLFVDGGANTVNVGTNNAGYNGKFNVASGTTTTAATFESALGGAGAACHIFMGVSTRANNGLQLSSMGSGAAINGGSLAASIFNTEAAQLALGGNNVYNQLILSSSEIVINDGGANTDFRVESDTGTHMLFVDAGGGYVTVGRETNLGSSVFTVQSNNNAGIAIGYGTGTNEYRRLYHHSSGLYFESSTNQAYLNAAGVWTDASDITYKKDIEDIDYGIETVKKLKPRKYKMKSDDQAQIGFVAQELVEQVPEIVSEKDGILGVAYGQLTAVLTKAIQEQQELIKTLEARITALES